MAPEAAGEGALMSITINHRPARLVRITKVKPFDRPAILNPESWLYRKLQELMVIRQATK